MELKAKKSRRKYKNTDKWLDAVYRNNKELIDNVIEEQVKLTKEVNVKKDK